MEPTHLRIADKDFLFAEFCDHVLENYIMTHTLT